MILLTGITGKSGTAFLRSVDQDRELCERESFRAIIRDRARTSTLDACKNMKVERVYGDLQDETLLDRAMQGVDTVLHIAGIRMSPAIVQAALRHGVKWLVLVHTTGIYSKYKSASAGYKRIEADIKARTAAADVPVTILRPTMIYGSPEDRNMIVFIRMMDSMRVVPVVNHAAYALQPVFADDLGVAYHLVLRNAAATRGKDYVLSGGNPIQLIDILKTIATKLRRTPRFLSVPFPIAYAGAWALFLASLSRVDLREKVQRLVEPRAFDHDPATRDFGYAPVAFEQGITLEVQEYLRRKRMR